METKETNIWKFIQNKLQHNQKVMLLFVLESKGSSPGRKGFKMAVANEGDFIGTIGGGIMEFKLVEKARDLLLNDHQFTFLQEQFHDKEHSKNQSGMICSGSQVIAFVPLFASNLETVNDILQETKSRIQISPEGLSLNEATAEGLQYISEKEWNYTEPVKQQPVVHIIGGGHCGLALSQLMIFLGFYVHIYDDREDLNTLEANHYANEKHIVSYENICATIKSSPRDFIVIMTIGYRTDKIVLKQLINTSFSYLGLLGSAEKIKTLFAELIAEGISEDKLKKVFSPIGLQINSKTTQEIAVSIAAEIIKEKNNQVLINS
jgi:xanthine dehydrogenase accessory factor